MKQQPGQPQTFNVDISKLENMKCSCGNNVFIPFSQIKHVSALYTPLGKDVGHVTTMHICINPLCGIMYPGAMSSHEVKKFKKNPRMKRFAWGDFFSAGIALAGAMAEARKMDESKKN